MRRSTGTTQNLADIRLNADYQRARAWVFAHWSEDEREMVMTAIRDSVAAELCERDNRCYDIPSDGKVTQEVYDEKGNVTAMEADAVKRSQVHSGRDHTHEVKRRWRAWVCLYPLATYAIDWAQAIQDDDGLDADGQPLCQEHGGHRDSSKADYRTGFEDRLPKWLRKPNPDWCERLLSPIKPKSKAAAQK